MVFRVEFLLLLLLSMFTRSPTTLFRFGTNVVLFWFKLLFYSRDDFICLNSVIHEKIGWMWSFFFSTIWCLDAFVCMPRFVKQEHFTKLYIFRFFFFKLFFFALWCICFHLGVFFSSNICLSFVLPLSRFEIAEFSIYLFELLLYIFDSLTCLFWNTPFFSDFFHSRTHIKRLISHTHARTTNIKLINLHKYYSFDIHII